MFTKQNNKSKIKLIMKNLKKLSKSDLKMISGGWVPPPGGYCPAGSCQYTESGPCRTYDPERCY